MGSAVGQVPEYIEMVTRRVKKHIRMPVIVQLTPNITDIREPAEAETSGGADAVGLINRINSINSADLDLFAPEPTIDGTGAHGGYFGPAVKPIALNMGAEIARGPVPGSMPISGIGGITTWRDAAKFIALGVGNVQVCIAGMTYAFKIAQEMISGLSDYMDNKGINTVDEIVVRAVPNVTDWQYLNLNYVSKAKISEDVCISCGRCFAACEDTSHHVISISADRNFEVIDDECVACNLCVNVCQVEHCITMEAMTPGVTDPRTGETVKPEYANWTTHPNNPAAE